MAEPICGNIPLSALNPQYLHANSTSHTWPFSAIAELIDNAYDPDVNAKQLWIDWKRINDVDCLTFMDNGAGMDNEKMHQMLSFGFSNKQGVGGHAAVGLYGNGFKSGSMRLGKDAIVFSKNQDGMTVGLLSQSYLQAIGARHVVVPIVTFKKDGEDNAMPEHSDSLKAILEHSLFGTVEAVLSEFKAIGDGSAAAGQSCSGTRIIIWNLRRTGDGQMEFDFETEQNDIQIPFNDCTNGQEGTSARPKSVPPMQYSLRAYCSILYLKPWMQILIRGAKVKTQLVSKSLAHTITDQYKPQFLKQSIRIIFGYNTKSKEQYGIMMYHKNRLIRAYERVGCQLKANAMGVGVIGIIECDFLKPTHNKQDFDDTEEYRKIKYNLGVKLKEYWDEIRYKRKAENPNSTTEVEDMENTPDQQWVQCTDCSKWRKLPKDTDVEALPDNWFCHMNKDSEYRSCRVPEEPEESGEEQPYEKTFKKQEKKKKEQQKRNRQLISEDTEQSQSPFATPVKESGTRQSMRASLRRDLTADSSSLSNSDITPSLNSTLDTSNAVTPLPTERMKRKLLDFGNEGVKRARVNYPQSDEEDITAMLEQFISYNDDVDGNFTEKSNELKEPVVVKGEMEDNQDGTNSAGGEKKTEETNAMTLMALPPLTQIKEEVITNTEMDNAVRVKEEEVEDERNEGSSLVEDGPARFGNGNEKPQQLLLEVPPAAKEKDWIRDQGETTSQERDQKREKMETTNQERDQNNEEVQPFSMNGDQDGMIMEAVTQEKDHHRMEMEITSEERDQFNEVVQPISRDQDQYSMEVETITRERDGYREQVNQLTSKLKKFEELLSKNNKERDELKVKCERLQKELEDVKRETQGRALQNGQHTEHSKVKTEM